MARATHSHSYKLRDRRHKFVFIEKHSQLNHQIRYDTIEEFNEDSKAEYSPSKRNQKQWN